MWHPVLGRELPDVSNGDSEEICRVYQSMKMDIPNKIK